MKKFAKNIIVGLLARKVRKLRKKNNFKVVAIGGSIGKTSTKFAIAAVLKQKYRVQFQEGNYNDPVTVPLVYFGLPQPNIFNPMAWWNTFRQINQQLEQAYAFDVVIVELGTDGPGHMASFKKSVKADIGVLTAISPEHMEFFKDLDDVAKEELAIADYSGRLFVNKDLVAEKYLNQLKKPVVGYALKQQADFKLSHLDYKDGAYDFEIYRGTELLLAGKHHAIAETQLYSVCAAAAVAHELGLTPQQINKGIDEIKAVSGRMKHLKGVNNSTIIDDTYNASPEAMKAALDTIYKIEAPQKIAVLGNMNELGQYSASAHTEIGEYCDPKQLDMVVTIGPDANTYLATAAEKKGCFVVTFNSPYEAGDYIKPLVQNGAVILAKGSQNGVFAEETVKLLLGNFGDAEHLVRQSNYWLGVKRKQFKDYA